MPPKKSKGKLKSFFGNVEWLITFYGSVDMVLKGHVRYPLGESIGVLIGLSLGITFGTWKGSLVGFSLGVLGDLIIGTW